MGSAHQKATRQHPPSVQPFSADPLRVTASPWTSAPQRHANSQSRKLVLPAVGLALLPGVGLALLPGVGLALLPGIGLALLPAAGLAAGFVLASLQLLLCFAPTSSYRPHLLGRRIPLVFGRSGGSALRRFSVSGGFGILLCRVVVIHDCLPP